MTPAEALAEIRGFASAGRYQISGHALASMSKRNIQGADIRSALRGAATCEPANEPDRWKVTGPDLDGDELHVVVAIDNGLVVVTAW